MEDVTTRKIVQMQLSSCTSEHTTVVTAQAPHKFKPDKIPAWRGGEEVSIASTHSCQHSIAARRGKVCFLSKTVVV